MTPSQKDFNGAVLNPELPVPTGLSDSTGRAARRRFDVYRNNVVVSLRDAMHVAFPVIAKLLGKQNMDALAGLFLRAHPPTTPLLMHYGTAFPAFLADTEQLAHLGYLPDVARLELAIRRSYHSADAIALEPQVLARLSPVALMRATVTLAPAVQLIRSAWPILDIWRFNTQGGAPKPRAVAQDVLIPRPAFDPVPHLLPDGGAEWVLGLMRGLSIGAAYDAALAQTADFDLTTTLTLLVQGGALTGLASIDQERKSS